MKIQDMYRTGSEKEDKIVPLPTKEDMWDHTVQEILSEKLEKYL